MQKAARTRRVYKRGSSSFPRGRWARNCAAALACVSLSSACGGAARSGEHSAVARRPPDHAARLSATGQNTPGATAPAELYALCERHDATLAKVAFDLATGEAHGKAPLAAGDLAVALRSRGEPHAWPRAWTLTGGSRRETRERLGRWLQTLAAMGERRCGLAQVRDRHGNRVTAAVVVDALADFQDMPVRARTGQWLRIDAQLLVPAANAKVVALGPRGRPRPVPTSLRDGRVRAALSVDDPGTWLIQVLASVETGPRPLLEALVFVDASPNGTFEPGPTPGEEAARGGASEVIVRNMLNAARRAEGAAPLDHDARLDALARGHAETMRQARRLGHDVGDGDPHDRLAEAGLHPARVGENVVVAADLVGAHRAAWASPAHRANLLDPAFSSVGVGVARETDGTVWVCTLFADFGRAEIDPRAASLSP